MGRHRIFSLDFFVQMQIFTATPTVVQVAKEGHTYLASTYIFLPQYTVKFFAQPCFSFHLPQLLFFSLQPTSLPPSDDTHFAGAGIVLATLFVCGTSFAISTTMKEI
jgi:hypothetical protein